MNDTLTTQPENLRDRIVSGYLYSMIHPSGVEEFGGALLARSYYDKMILAGDIPEDIIETILQYRDDSPIALSNLVKGHNF